MQPLYCSVFVILFCLINNNLLTGTRGRGGGGGTLSMRGRGRTEASAEDTVALCSPNIRMEN